MGGGRPVPPQIPEGAPYDRVTPKPQDAILRAEDLPISGYTVAKDQPAGSGWLREFVPANPSAAIYYWLSVELQPVGSGEDWVAGQSCSSIGGGSPAASRLDAPAVGAAARLCRFTSDGGRIFELFTGADDVGVAAQANPRDASVPDASVALFLKDLAKRQLDVALMGDTARSARTGS